MPSCAATARRRQPALSSGWSVATIASVVLPPGPCPSSAFPPLPGSARQAGYFRFTGNASGSTGDGAPRSPNSSSTSNGAAQKRPVSGSTAEPFGFAATSAPTVAPPGSTRDAEPSPPFRFAVVAPVPAPTEPSPKSADASPSASRPRARHGGSVQSAAPPPRRSNRIADGTIGTRTGPTA